MAGNSGRVAAPAQQPDDRGTAASSSLIEDALVGALLQDPQSTNRALGAQVGLGEIEVARRLRRLDETNAMRLTAILDIHRGGFSMLAHVVMEFERGQGVSLMREISAQSTAWNVSSINSLRGRPEIEATFRIVDRADLTHLMRARLASLTGVKRVTIETTVQILRYRPGVAQLGLQNREGSIGNSIRDLERAPLPAHIDDLDRRIIASLQSDGRSSSRNLARRWIVSEGTIRYRLKKLEACGLMKLIPVRDMRSIGLRAILRIRMTVRPSRLASVTKGILGNAAVSYAALTTGGYNLHVVLICADDAASDSAVSWIRSIAGVDDIRTTYIANIPMFDHRWQVLGP